MFKGFSSRVGVELVLWIWVKEQGRTRTLAGFCKWDVVPVNKGVPNVHFDCNHSIV